MNRVYTDGIFGGEREEGEGGEAPRQASPGEVGSGAERRRLLFHVNTM